MKTAAEIVVIFKKFLDNRHTQADLDALVAYFDQAADYTTLRDLVYEELKRLDSEGVDQQEIKELLQDVDHKLANRLRRHRITRLYIRCAGAAAILIVTLSTGYYFYQPHPTAPPNTSIANEIKPGFNQATLTLADGTKVNLDSAKSGIQISDKDISYNDGTKIVAKTIVNSTMLTLSTPKGGQYQIILSDGTKVWLNAASTLKYPSRFSGDRREVILEGEGYFEVNNNPSIDGMQANRKSYLVNRKSTVPFIVKSKNQEITVLGTSFNVKAFADEKETKTTLVEGKVQVRSKNLKLKTYNVQLLAPMQQAVVNGDNLTISEIDINNELAWRQNKFSFEGKTFRQIMDEVARWYDLEVVYDGPVPEATFFGDAYRNKNLSIVLGLLQSAHIHYQVEPGHRLVIHNQNGKDKPIPKK
ncbi:FecR family protein [bacterium A37T11]|nr:FecR family protein [bacterium A37T11]